MRSKIFFVMIFIVYIVAIWIFLDLFKYIRIKHMDHFLNIPSNSNDRGITVQCRLRIINCAGNAEKIFGIIIWQVIFHKYFVAAGTFSFFATYGATYLPKVAVLHKLVLFEFCIFFNWAVLCFVCANFCRSSII